MSRVLVYFHEKYMAPSGGPSGYLYNLKNHLAASKGEPENAASAAPGEPEIVFLNDKEFHSRFSFLARKAVHRVISSGGSLSGTG